MEQIVLDDWQKKILETQGNICLRSGRQVGKSTCISVLAGDYAATNNDKTIMIIAAVERQAYLLFEKVLNYMESKYRRLILGGSDRPTKTEIRLSNGCRILCLPSGLTGYGIRGYSIDLLIVDEAAFVPEEVYNAVTPALAARYRLGARIVLLSTPFGREGYFARAFQDLTFTKFHVSSEECPRISKDFLAQEKARLSKRVYTQEYLGEFVDDLMQWFPDKLILECMKLKRPGSIPKSSDLYMGVDLARMGEDESVFAIVKRTQDNKLIHIEHQITKRTYLSQSTKHIINLNKMYDFQKIFIDDEGIGVGVFDHLLQEESTRRKIIPINNSKRVIDRDDGKVRLLKEDLYNNLLRMMELGEIQLLDDPEIFQSLKSVQFEYTADTRGRSHLKIFGNYTHTAEALIRAAWCVREKGLNIWIKSI